MHWTEVEKLKTGPPTISLGLLLVCLASAARAERPLHQRIDEHIEAKAGDVAMRPTAGEAEFVRRVYLDLAGRIPSVAETRQFLDDPSADKRARLIDQLLAGPDYPRRMQELFNAMLMERRVEDEEWTRFLRRAFEQNLPWDAVAHAILKPDPTDEDRRGAAYFMTARLVSEGAMAAVDVPGLTRDVGRLLAGVDLQCAQCHDHLTVSDYSQRDFQGLHMIFENVQTQRGTDFPAIGEKLMTQKQEYMSVFIQQPQETNPRVPGGQEIPIQLFDKDEQYVVTPDKKKRTPGEPRFSPLRELAAGLASAENDLFCRNIVNRLWFVMMGRGMVEPLDLQHSENPPTHPELLDLLAHELAAHRFDIRWLLRELALSDTYQRTSVLPAGQQPPAPAAYAVALEKRLSAEQLFWSAVVATGNVRGKEIEQQVADSEDLQKLQQLFVKSFANPPKEPEVDFEPSVKAALFLMHDDRLLKLLQPRSGNLAERLQKLDDAQLADELFTAVLSRPPTDDDRKDVTAYLQDHQGRRAEAIGHLIWSLLASTEFCVNH